jgi:hypothetical protein
MLLVVHRCLDLFKDALSTAYVVTPSNGRRKETIIIRIHQKGDKSDCNNYGGISLLSTAYKILSNILLSRLTPCVNEIIGDHQCGFRRNRSATDQIFYILQILEKKWEYNGMVHQLFIDFKKACDSFKREVLYNILLELCIPKTLIRIIKMCPNETCSKVRIGKFCLINFLFRMGWNKEMLYRHCFSVLL